MFRTAFNVIINKVFWHVSAGLCPAATHFTGTGIKTYQRWGLMSTSSSKSNLLSVQQGGKEYIFKSTNEYHHGELLNKKIVTYPELIL